MTLMFTDLIMSALGLSCLCLFIVATEKNKGQRERKKSMKASHHVKCGVFHLPSGYIVLRKYEGRVFK
jgi:hypothetical protein